MKLLLRLLSLLFAAFLTAGAVGVGIGIVVYLQLAPELPQIVDSEQLRMQVPLRVLAADRQLIAEYGEERRIPVAYHETPKRLRQAFIAAEDDQFFMHAGVDHVGLLRAFLIYARSGEASQGGSTITMQLARNLFLTAERSIERKMREILLAFRLERELSKEQILEQYMNQIYLGNRAYGVAAAAQIYYGKTLSELDLSQLAMIAGLPKAPSAYNPLANPERARIRRNYVLRRMKDLAFISDDDFESARGAELTAARHHRQQVEVEAPYIGEMVRAAMVERFGEAGAYGEGVAVVTTIEPSLQREADRAVQSHLIDYHRRHGYRGPVAQLEQVEGKLSKSTIDETFKAHQTIGPLLPAVVTAISDQSATAILKDGQRIELPKAAWEWAAPYVSVDRVGARPKRAADVMSVGDLIYLEPRPDEGDYLLAQPPVAQAALVALNPDDGAVIALSGGFDYYDSKFNRVAQATRQPGSNIKPFVYSAALERGYAPASIIYDTPLVIQDLATEGVWKPKNYSGGFKGPMRLRVALYTSRNLVSVRLIRNIGVGFAVDHLERFGFDRETLPRNLTLALGTLVITPLDLAARYATFANGGYRVDPYFIQRIETTAGELIEEASPKRVCRDCDMDPEGEEWAPRVISAENHYLMHSMMRDVIRFGTGRKALTLKRKDLAGKTGTTNEQRDAWFSGFNRDVVATVWFGFDQPQPLGRRETGAGAALPVWIDFMKSALADSPEWIPSRPPGIVGARVDPTTGLISEAPDAIADYFMAGALPERQSYHSDDGVEVVDPYATDLF